MRLHMLALALIACDGADPDTDALPGDTDTDFPAEIALAGTFTDEWGTTHTITSTLWTQAPYGDAYHITQFDNATAYAIAQNDSANAFFPDAWSRFDWAESSGSTWYCQSAFDAADEAAALAATPADAGAPDTDGCGGFPWTNLTP